jgi:hypothetical protein
MLNCIIKRSLLRYETLNPGNILLYHQENVKNLPVDIKNILSLINNMGSDNTIFTQSNWTKSKHCDKYHSV